MPGSATRVATVVAAVMVLMVASGAQVDSQDAYAFNKALNEFYYGTSDASCKTSAEVILSEVHMCRYASRAECWRRTLRPAFADHHAIATEDSMQAVQSGEPSEL